MKKIVLLSLLIALSQISIRGEVEALFHPYDNTFEAIVKRFESARETIDMALYNLDDSKKNPIIAFINKPQTQKKLKSGALKIRLVFEGYEKKEKNLKKMMSFEAMGIDVRTLGMSKKMHHKFAVIDSGLADHYLITGSANWSLMSRKHFNENILFFDNEEGVMATYKQEFEFLWGLSKEIGLAKVYPTSRISEKSLPETDAKVFFNRENFVVKKGSLHKIRGGGFHLTNVIVKAIDHAQYSLDIATTRFKLRPIYNAVMRAASRGVQINLIVTMGEYEHLYSRSKKNVEVCEDEFKRICSSGKNFAMFLARNDFLGHENVNVRIKFFNLNTAAYLNKQMHSKYLIVDKELLLTGSFNWSYSGEFNHIENVVALDKKYYPAAMKSFQEDFSQLWDLRRSNYKGYKNRLYSALKHKKKTDCRFSPMSLTVKEIDRLLLAGRKFKMKTKAACL